MRILFLLTLACGWLLQPDGMASSKAQALFLDSTQASNLSFTHFSDGQEQGYLVSLMGSGLATFDYDNDGRIDVYFLNGCALQPQDAAEQPFNQLFRNLGKARFVDSTHASSTGLTEFSLGVAAADYDNDGFQDLCISNYRSATLYHNRGDGTFEDATVAAGLRQVDLAFGAGVAFLDADRDGQLDLYLADYVDFTMERFWEAQPKTRPYPPGPESFLHRSDHLLRNQGNGEFVEISQLSDIGQVKSPSMGLVAGDFDGDADTDIVVCSDARPNLFFSNVGDGVFSEEGLLNGVAYNATGVAVGSMGVEAADVDNDGWDDLFITDYSTQMPILFKNLEGFGFQDISQASRTGIHVIPHANWGAGLFDVDHDGDRDLMIANGHLFHWAESVEPSTSFRVQNSLLINDGRAVFQDVSDTSGAGMQLVESSRGLAFDDLDNDGDIDCVVLNNSGPANYLENATTNANRWIQIHLIGEHCNRDAIGAKVTVWAGGKRQVAEVRSGRGYQSHYGVRLHFGLGTADAVDSVLVNWLGSEIEYGPLQTNQLHQLKQPAP